MRIVIEIPKYIGDWIEYCKEKGLTLLEALSPIGKFGEHLAETFDGDAAKCSKWARCNSNNFAYAWVNGYYELEPSKYIVRMNNISDSNKVLKHGYGTNEWYFGTNCVNETKVRRVKHTKKELIGSGFDWVFLCDGVTIEEVY